MSQVSQIPRKRWFADTRRLAQSFWVVLGVAMVYSLAWTIGKTEEFQVLDFGAYYRAGAAVARGQTPYFVDEHGVMGTFVYAPAFAYLCIPLSCLDYVWTIRVWMLLNWGLCLVCMVLAWELIARRREPDGLENPSYRNDRGGMVWSVLWLALIPVANYFWANVRAGQVGTLMLVLCLGWAVCQRRGQPFLGGLLLAAGCALKLAPCLLLPYLVVRRDWRGLAGVAVGFLCLLALPAHWLGWQGAVNLHHEWLHHCHATQVPIQTFRPANHSLLGQLARLPWISDGQTCFSLANLHQLEKFYYPLLLVLAAGIYGWILWDRWRGVQSVRGGARTAQREAVHGRLALLHQPQLDNLHLIWLLTFMTLAHPRAWSCNFVALVLPCMFLADHVCRHLPGWKVALAALGFVILVSAIPTPTAPGWSAPAWVVQGRHFWGALAAAAACWWAYARYRKECSAWGILD